MVTNGMHLARWRWPSDSLLASFPSSLKGRRESLFVLCLVATKFHGSWISACNIHVMMTLTLWLHCCWNIDYLWPPAPWMQSDDFQTTPESVFEVRVCGKGHFPVAAHWFWQITMLWSSTLRVLCDAVLCNSPQPDCGSSPSPPLLSPTVSRTLHECAMADHHFQLQLHPASQ